MKVGKINLPVPDTQVRKENQKLIVKTLKMLKIQKGTNDLVHDLQLSSVTTSSGFINICTYIYIYINGVCFLFIIIFVN